MTSQTNTLASTSKRVQPPRSLSTLVQSIIGSRYFLYTLSIAIFLSIWDLAALNKVLGNFLPRPVDVLIQLWSLNTEPLASKTLFEHLWASIYRVLIGWAIGVLFAVPLGIFMGLNPYVKAVVKPVFDLLKPMPPISWISLSILWFGLGNGIRLIDPALYDAARMLGASRRQEILEVGFFASAPAIFAGLQISLSIAWSCVLAAELVGSRSGMGFIIILGMNQSAPALIIAGMVVIAITAFLISVVMERLENVICPWKRELPQ